MLSIQLTRGHFHAWHAQIVDGCGVCWGAAAGRDLSEVLLLLADKAQGSEQKLREAYRRCHNAAK